MQHATFLSLSLTRQPIGFGIIWDMARFSAKRTTSSEGNTGDEPKGGTCKEVRMRRYLLTVGGKAFIPHIPFVSFWSLV